MGFSRQEYWSELPFPPQGIFLTQGSNSYLSSLLHWPGGSSPLCHLGSLLLYSFQIQQKSGSPPAQPPPLLSRGFSEQMSLADEKFSLMKVRYSDAGGRWPGCFPYNDTDVYASHVFSSFYYLNIASWQGTVQFGAVFEMNISGWFLHYILWSLPFFTQYCVLEMSFLFVRCNRRDLSSQTRSQTHACCNGSTES